MKLRRNDPPIDGRPLPTIDFPRPGDGDPDRILTAPILRYENGAWTSTTDDLAAEEPFQIQIAGHDLVMIMRTPGQDRFLAAGFLLSEGIVQSAEDIVSWEIGRDRDGFPDLNVLDLRLRRELEAQERPWERSFSVTASCGLCGAASIEAVRRLAPLVPSGDRFAGSVIRGLETKLRAAQAVFSRTGGLHGAGLFDAGGDLLAAHEDVGRHNAVDKVLGQMLVERRLPLTGTMLLVSGRSSFELVQKAAIAGVPLLAAVGAPSSLAVQLALATGMTLIGMLRPERLVVYSRPERIDQEI